MTDKNGIEIKTGSIVEITGAYFKNDNGLYFVTNSPGDPSWSGHDHCLTKISKRGKISKAKYNLCFWPISIYTNDLEKRAKGSQWNHEHATIEVKAPLQDMSEVVAYFQDRIDALTDQIRRDTYNWGEDHTCVQQNKAIRAHYAAVIRAIREEAAA